MSNIIIYYSNKVLQIYYITTVIENQRVVEQQASHETGKTSEQIDKEFEKKQKKAMEKFNEELTSAISDFAKESTKETVKTVGTKKKEREKKQSRMVSEITCVAFRGQFRHS